MNWEEKIKKRYDALSNEDQAKLYLLAIFKGYTKEPKRRQHKKVPLSKADKQKGITEKFEIDLTSIMISGSEKEWEKLFEATQHYKGYSYAELNKSLKDGPDGSPI